MTVLAVITALKVILYRDLKARLIAARHNAPPAFLRSDNGPEFVLKATLSSRRTALHGRTISVSLEGGQACAARERAVTQ